MVARDRDFSKFHRDGGGQSAIHSPPRLEKPPLSLCCQRWWYIHVRQRLLVALHGGGGCGDEGEGGDGGGYGHCGGSGGVAPAVSWIKRGESGSRGGVVGGGGSGAKLVAAVLLAAAAAMVVHGDGGWWIL
nr:hypothetical protein [Tanacetum cinerariifolium]